MRGANPRRSKYLIYMEEFTPDEQEVMDNFREQRDRYHAIFPTIRDMAGYLLTRNNVRRSDSTPETYTDSSQPPKDAA